MFKIKRLLKLHKIDKLINHRYKINKCSNKINKKILQFKKTLIINKIAIIIPDLLQIKITKVVYLIYKITINIKVHL